jgi:outer membrane protein assembly factor BamB
MNHRHSTGRLSCCIIVVLLTTTSHADDWPQWRGPQQDGISREKGLLAKWPENGPKELWRVPLGNGFSAVSVVGDRAYTCFGINEGEFAVCLNVADGKTVSKVRLGDLYQNGDYGDGPRATPTVDAGLVYVLGARGALVCFDANSGKQVWSADLLALRGGKLPEYGFSASPVIVDDKVIAVVGAGGGKSLAAYNKSNGNLAWTSLDNRIGYSTPRAVTADGVPQIIVLMGDALVSVSPSDGKEFWNVPWKTELDANVATPVFSGDQLFISTGYSTGCELFQLSAKGGKPAAEKVWANKEMKNYFATSVLWDGYLYGFDNNKLACQDIRTGKVKWRASGFNRGSLIVADGRLIILSASGTLALAEPSPEKYKEISKFQFCDERTWTVPTVAGGRLFVRNEKELTCYLLGTQR